MAGNAQILNVEHFTENEAFTAIGSFKDQLQGGKNNGVHLETEVPGVVPTVSWQVAMNGQLKNMGNGAVNGFIPNGRLFDNHM